MATPHKYPLGMQVFCEIRREGFLYVDKTQLIHQMMTEGKFYFLSRPRRFGKTLLLSTLEAIFQGRRDLFDAFTTAEGIEQPRLYIATTDWAWETHPVLRFDFSRGIRTIEDMDDAIVRALRWYEGQYHVTPDMPNNYSARLEDIIQAAHAQTGRRVVVLVDEYDSLMLDSMGDSAKQTAVRDRFQSLFGPLKALDAHLRFVLITGITKFSQMSIFSKLNQLNNISMNDCYEALCGITEAELTTIMRPDIERLADRLHKTYGETLAELKRMYDGYHFSRQMTDIYNPYSLLGAFYNGNAEETYWFSTGTPSVLISYLAQMPPFELTDVDGVRFRSTAFDLPIDSVQSPTALLYQSGYLTIKDYQPDRGMYTLGFPNREVRTGFADCLFQYVACIRPDDKGRSATYDAYCDLRDTADLPPFIRALQSFFAGIPYVLSGKGERHYHALLYTLLVSFGADVVPEEMSAKGRADLVLRMPRAIYVMEIKYDHPAAEALRQIDEQGYAAKYAADGRPVVKVGLSFSSAEKNITEWLIEPAG